jgi:dihydropteroate synthase
MHFTQIHRGKQPQIMAIINATPDSFYALSKVEVEPNQALELAYRHIAGGAQILDIGGMSSRPGAEIISAEQECARVLPVIEAIRLEWPDILISVDTWRGDVARQAYAAGANIVNDISAGAFDPTLWPTVAQLGVPYVLMHMQGTPKTMQNQPIYKQVTIDIYDFFVEKIRQLRAMGIGEIWIDPGFGFGKTLDHNYQLLAEANQFQILNCPLMIGLSRKGMIYKALHTTPEAALNGTTALHMFALMQGAQILRVHDAREASECISLWEHLGRPLK